MVPILAAIHRGFPVSVGIADGRTRNCTRRDQRPRRRIRRPCGPHDVRRHGGADRARRRRHRRRRARARSRRQRRPVRRLRLGGGRRYPRQLVAASPRLGGRTAGRRRADRRRQPRRRFDERRRPHRGGRGRRFDALRHRLRSAASSTSSPRRSRRAARRSLRRDRSISRRMRSRRPSSRSRARTPPTTTQ